MKNYEQFLTKDYLMGPSCLRLLDELMKKAPEAVKGRVLDLGCGCAVSSLYAAREGAPEVVYAGEMWTSPTDNYRRICRWGMGEKIIPLRLDANQMPFAEEYFDAVISLDAYHYFGREKGFFQEKILPVVKKGGSVLLAMPGIKEEFGGHVPALMTEWAGDEWDYFHSCAWWKELLETGSEDCLEVITWESERFEQSWQDWYQTGHEFALRDKEFLEAGLKEWMNFVMIHIRKK